MGSYAEPVKSGTVQEDYGRRLLPTVVEDAARKRPDRVAYSFPVTDDPAAGFHDITNRRFAIGVNRTAWWIERCFGKPEPKSFPTIGYIGPNDLQYGLLMLAAVKVGFKMLFLSPRNSIDGHLAVIDRCGCDLWVLPAQRVGHVDQLLERRPMKVMALPELLELLAEAEEKDVPPYPYLKTFDEARQDPFVVLHTSGSTGLPKPIIVPNGSPATVDAHHLLPPIEGRLSQAQYFTTPHRAYSTFPNFHSAGMVWCFVLPFFYELSVVLGPAMVPVNLDLVNAMLDHGNVDGSLLAPSTLEEISKDPASLERMAKTQFTCFGGGPLSQECGNRINAVTRVFNTVGVTEGSLFPIVQAEREDWNYIHFHPAGGYTYRPRFDGLWEQFQTRNPKLHLFQAFFQTFPDETEIAIKDLYAEHPTKPGRYLYKGRADDVIVLSNGEKLNPLDMEACINNHPAVKACLVVGQGRFQTTALIQLIHPLPGTDDEIQSLKDSIWLNIAVANQQAPAHAQLHKDYIMFAAEEKPFILAGKETVLRAMTVKLYEAEINDFYAQREREGELSDTDVVSPIDLSSRDSIQQGLHDLLSRVLGVTTLGSTDDMFAAGLDSLSVFKILRGLRATFQAPLPSTSQSKSITITPSLIYKNPTVQKLSDALYRLAHPGAEAEYRDNSQDESAGAHVDEASESETAELMLMQSLLGKYTSTLPERERGPPPPTPQGISVSVHDSASASAGASASASANHAKATPPPTASVILTGSTGSLGSYLLDTLLRQSHVSRVFCLNRSADAEARQAQSNKARGLQDKFKEDLDCNDNCNLSGRAHERERVRFIQADLSKPQFGLDASVYDELLRETTHIIHNQWQVDFNLSLSSFEPHIRGVRHLVDFALHSAHHRKAGIFFVSSIGVVNNQGNNIITNTNINTNTNPNTSTNTNVSVPVPETLITDLTLAEGGYGRSKLVSELILSKASSISGVKCTVCRVGQIAGPVDTELGMWNKQEWLPLILASSRHLKILPSTLSALDRVDWLPVNRLSQIIVELAGLDTPDQSQSHHPAQPQPPSKAPPPPPFQVFHTVNPSSRPWSTLVPTLTSLLGPSVRVVSWDTWLAALRASETNSDLAQNPAIKILDFYTQADRQGRAGLQLPMLETKATAAVSRTLRDIEPVGPEWMEQWMRQWNWISESS
ncbi:hypothetical protein A1O3_03640 [Capronia epimyces CBS 606.96]|uniref:Carrier domain-containing protein n=1 Tax=Capronia epimyces CBS 606.96 TaxID=1182542 RepID=W9Y1J4_9EURO|nr:uncharacterized protein A1O3_03640 [Capronia epimyces CBS 606.96]EXJ86687.1 hypothetical protein A1O3_03640 [Capronia epimyces CBS 606.96]